MSKKTKNPRAYRLMVNLTWAEMEALKIDFICANRKNLSLKWSDFIRNRLFPKTDNTAEDE